MKSSKTDWAAIQRDEAEKLYRKESGRQAAQLKAYAEALSQVKQERDAALALRSAPIAPPILSVGSEHGSEATAFAIGGDWHVEETVDPKSVNGLNTYDLSIAQARIQKFFKSIVRLTEIQRNGTRVDNLVLILLGDLMTGYIHEELQESNGLSPTETIIWLREQIVAGLRLLLKDGAFKRIDVLCSYGNHGRTTKKPRHSTGAKNSYEWMLYQILKLDVPEVNWNIADGYHLFYECYGRTFRVHHGDNVQYQGGIGGLTIPTEKAIANWNKAHNVYLDIFGHHHTAQQNPRWICNGSLIGYGAYSIAIKAAFEPPQQTYFLLDSKRGRTGTWPIYLS
ncbi:MAG: hypothetical protein KGL39_45570 [Patescibacteria group bacterium]|nr:hypothetical protein [Patescibacteria group bacterium]